MGTAEAAHAAPRPARLAKSAVETCCKERRSEFALAKYFTVRTRLWQIRFTHRAQGTEVAAAGALIIVQRHRYSRMEEEARYCGMPFKSM